MNIKETYNKIFDLTGWLKSPANLAVRGYLFYIFFFSGWLKFNSWETTLMLFEYEYDVPIIPFELAAYMATAGEIILPILLVIGLLTKPAAIGLFILNFVAVISYPDISAAGVQQHMLWGALSAYLIIYGGEKWNLDYFIFKCKGKKIEKQSEEPVVKEDFERGLS